LSVVCVITFGLTVGCSGNSGEAKFKAGPGIDTTVKPEAMKAAGGSKPGPRTDDH